MGARLADGLRSLAADGAIDHVRGAGAVWAIGLRADQDATAVRDDMLASGVITRAIGTDTCTFCPPLVTTDDEIDRIVDAVAAAVA
jgi:adenosylmethionine-8-amino-7-oxononanoate aminotransferase